MKERREKLEVAGMVTSLGEQIPPVPGWKRREEVWATQATRQVLWVGPATSPGHDLATYSPS